MKPVHAREVDAIFGEHRNNSLYLFNRLEDTFLENNFL